MDKCVNRPMQFWCFTTANVTEPLSVSPKATSTPRRAFVDTAPVNDKISQRLIQIFEFRRLPQRAGPLAASPMIDIVAICRAKNHRWLKPSASTA